MPPQVLEINPKHPIIRGLYNVSRSETTPDQKLVGELVAAQILDNALIAAGLVDDPRTMLPRLNDILSATLNKK